MARAAQNKDDIDKYKRNLGRLRANYTGRRGRYSASDTRIKNTADEALKYLYDGITLSEGRAAAKAGRERLLNERRAANAAQRNVAHHAAAPDTRQRIGVAAAATRQRIGVAIAAPRAATADEQPPDENESNVLLDDVNERCFCESPAQIAFNAWAQAEALAGRGDAKQIGGTNDTEVAGGTDWC